MRSLRESRQTKLHFLEQGKTTLLLVLASRKTSLLLASRAKLSNTTALLEEKVCMTESEIHKIDKKIARLKRKIKEKN